MACNIYTPPTLNIGTFTLDNECTTNADANTMANYAAENIEIGGAGINIYPLLGVHEQGLLIDLAGEGTPISGGTLAGSDITNAFNITADVWQSSQTGSTVTAGTCFIGYNFGTKKTKAGTEKYAPSSRILHHITSLRITQGSQPQNRITQGRIESSNGELERTIVKTGTGNGQLMFIQDGYFPRPNKIFIVAISPTVFSISDQISGFIKNVNTEEAFGCQDIRFKIVPGTIPFISGDTFTIDLTQIWKRVDVVNFPNTSTPEIISIKQSYPAAFWRIVPLIFSGNPGDSWEIERLELMDYQVTKMDNIQDTLFMENRDRDYSHIPVPLKVAYQASESLNDLGKFGFSIMDQYSFTCSFARMIEVLHRPIVIGDVIEVIPEAQYDVNLKLVRKFVEVTDTGWATEGFTPTWQPLLFRFVANQVLPSQEHRDLFGTPEQQQYILDDGNFFCEVVQHQSTPGQISKQNTIEAVDKVVETGQDATQIASGMPRIPTPVEGQPLSGEGQSDQQDLYIEDGMPPDGLPFGEGFTLPDVNTAVADSYFRLNYPQNLNIPTRLFRFSAAKHRWIYQETDMRQAYSSHKPSMRNALVSSTKKPLDA